MNEKKLFRVVKTKRNDDDVFIIVCGNSRAAALEFNSEEDAWEYIQGMGLDWDMIVTVIGEMIEIIEKIKNDKK